MDKLPLLDIFLIWDTIYNPETWIIAITDLSARVLFELMGSHQLTMNLLCDALERAYMDPERNWWRAACRRAPMFRAE